MIDKTNNTHIRQINHTANKQIYGAPNKSYTNESKDSFIKSKYKDKLIKSDEQMAAVLSMNSFKYLAQGLIEKECFYNGTDGVKLYLDNKNPVIAVGIMDFDTEITEQYHYTSDEFINLLKKIKEKAAKRGIESTDEYEKLYSELIEKLQVYSQKNK